MNELQKIKPWIGRFAPTPSGPLHFGSLVAALGSYIIARQKGGKWLLRIEDLDPPREFPGAADQILKTLEVFGFEWDGQVVYQSQRQQYYQQSLEQLTIDGLVYHCNCSRKLIHQRNGGIYDNFCRERELASDRDASLRIHFNSNFSDFHDEIFGRCSFKGMSDTQDFVIRRRDGLFAYQLAVVVDDLEQGINHVVRGADILDSTPRQNFLYHCLNAQAPQYYHLPLVIDQNGEKLSKRKFSPAISAENASEWLVQALLHLGQKVGSGLVNCLPHEVLSWAIDNWRVENISTDPKVFIGEAG